MKKKRIAIFASGNGSNAENIIRYFREAGSPDVEPALVVCNKADAYVLERAARLGVPSVVVPRKDFKNEELVTKILRDNEIDFIVLAGFLVMIPEYLVNLYPGKIVNIHPSLLPKYGGKGMYGSHVHEAVVAAGEKESGITIHVVDEHYARGPILFQAKVALLPSDAPDDVAAKVHELEYAHFPRVIGEVIEGKL